MGGEPLGVRHASVPTRPARPASQPALVVPRRRQLGVGLDQDRHSAGRAPWVCWAPLWRSSSLEGPEHPVPDLPATDPDWSERLGPAARHTLFSMFFFILYMQQVLPLQRDSRRLLPALSLTIFIAAGLGGQLVTGSASSHPGDRRDLRLSRLSWSSQLSVGGALPHRILGPSLLAGVGFGFVTSTIAGVSGVDWEQGMASGLINTSQQIGGALGLAVLSTPPPPARITSSRRAPGPPESLAEGFQTAFLGGAMMAALGVVATLVLIRTRDSKAHVEMSNNRRSPSQPTNESRGLRVAPVPGATRCQPRGRWLRRSPRGGGRGSRPGLRHQPDRRAGAERDVRRGRRRAPSILIPAPGAAGGKLRSKSRH